MTWMAIVIEAHRSLTRESLNKVPCTKLKIYRTYRTLSYAIKETFGLLSVRVIVNAPNSMSTSGTIQVTMIPTVMSDTSPRDP